MVDPIFELVATRLRDATGFDNLEARGTLRIALKLAGLEPRGLSREQMLTVLEGPLSGQLKSRGVENTDAICEFIRSTLDRYTQSAGSATAESPGESLRRVGSR